MPSTPPGLAPNLPSTLFKPGIAALVLAAMGASASLHAAPALPAPQAGPQIKTSSCARPERPPDEKSQKHNGTSTWQFLIESDGKVVDARLHRSSGEPLLDEAARSALVKCRFKPPMVDGRAVRAWTAVQYVWN